MNQRSGYFEYAPLYKLIIAAILCGFSLCWPLYLNGGPLLFFDSKAYLSGGEKIFDYIVAMFVAADPLLATTGASGDAPTGRSIRSIFYSFFIFATSRSSFGYSVPVIIQTSLIAMTLLLFIPRISSLRQNRLVIGAVALAFLTPLPFYASLLMPDLLAAGVVLAALLIARTQSMRATVIASLTLTIATSSHYGNMPYAFVLGCIIVAFLAKERRLTVARSIALILPFFIAAGVNMSASKVAFDKASVAPRRLPILLARSLEDGPARWHLAAKCDVYDYAICTALPKIPDNVGAALWQKDGLASVMSVEVMADIRAEERIILLRAFADYPVQQTWSLTKNTVLQLGRFGLDDVYRGKVDTTDPRSPRLDVDTDRDRAVFKAFENLHIAVVIMGVFYLILRFVKPAPHGQHDRFVVGYLAASMVLNAAIFGGLSAPVDRYQGRIIWLLVFFAALMWARRDDAA